ncbi:peroxidase family protein [Devosia sp. XGJD_8]|uniref:peroxidase family protein n=1 Tax=Devosia sp. XGJD_8 TaxID=3391187 RepID=UPI0039852CF1
MVTYIKSDLEFILKQIQISEAHAAGTPLYGPGGLIPAYNIAWGLRTVDGSYNHLLPGQEYWGAADQPFPELLEPDFRTIMVDPDGLGPSPAIPITYTPGADADGPGTFADPGDVIDPEVRTISNLIVDQTLGNPAAILTALQRAGVDPALQLGITATISAAYAPVEPLFQAVAVAERDDAAASAAAAASPGNVLLQAAADAAAAALATARANLDAADDDLMALLDANGITLDGANVHLPNIAPDEGLSAPFNSWFTLFGQFFDHGLDLVNKGGSGTVMIPLQPDDPLYVPGSTTNFMVLTRATVGPGADGIMLDDPNTAVDESADNTRPVNTTTAYVDQNQTYTSHSSHQVFLRQYELNADGDPVATGKLIEGANGGMATWGELKAQARDLLGILLTDDDVGNVPLLRTDQYGNFIPAANGMPQIITGIGGDGIPNTADDIVVVGNIAAPVNPTTVLALRTGHAFLADIAHNAVPTGLADGDITIGLGNPDNGPAEDGSYDNELLDAHFIAGDGRVNENIGLTAVHHVFHAEHNRLVEHTKETVLADAIALRDAGASDAQSVAFLNEWLAVDVATIPANVNSLVWDGERLFQAAKFGTEMQYQHLVFEEFARKIQPNINVFLVPDGFDTTLDPSIVAEFAHVVYRFGHSMLTEGIDRFDPNFLESDIGLIEGFLNPTAFNGVGGSIADEVAAGAIIRGMTRQAGNEIDEFVTSALRNNLLGLPLDLATINLARGRDTGVPSLQAARRDFYEASNQNVLLKPYVSWVDFASHLKHEASIINFIAAYGTHSLITGATTLEQKRDVALSIITGVSVNGVVIPDDAQDFLNGTGAYANDLGGLENVDLWIGGLAEEIMPFGGMLGSTFNFVFEVQMEMLQSGDRFYYLQRLDGLHLFGEMENNSFAAMIMRNTDATHLPSDVFSTPGLILEVDQSRQFNDLNGDGVLESTDPVGTGLLTQLVSRNDPTTAGPDTNYLRYTGGDHVVIGGTDADDTIIAGIGDDTLYGDAGNDYLEGGFGNDILNGGDGDDIIVDAGGDDNIKGGAGNDVVHAGPGLDLVLAGAGHDFVFLGTDMGSEVFAGTGNDYIYGNKNAERILGNEGNDWIETGTFDGAPGDNFDEVFAHDGIDGHDVFLGDGGFDEFIGEGGDDIMVGSAGRGKMVGMSGFDWATYKDNTMAVNADIGIPIVFDEAPVLPQNASLDEYESVEGLSGTAFNDVLTGTNEDATTLASFANGGSGGGYLGSVLDAEGIALINGLQAVVGAGVTEFGSGDIILGGDGSDLITGKMGDDIIDGDKWLNVRIAVHESVGVDGGVGPVLEYANSMTQLASRMFSGEINPGQLRIYRNIETADGTGDTDIAVFGDDFANYTITSNGDGSIQVTHVVVSDGLESDGSDRVSNVEMLRFRDLDYSLVKPVVQLYTRDVASYLEDFATQSYSGTDSGGTTPWTTNWTETNDGPGAGSPTGGDIQITGGRLAFLSGTDGGEIVTRMANLTGATAATLTFDFEDQSLDVGENVVVEAYNGSTWQVLSSLGGSTPTGSASFSVNLTPAQIGAFSGIRFRTEGTFEGGENFYIDNIRLTYSSPAAVPSANYATTFNENGAAVAIASGPSITDDGTSLVSARVLLTNAQLGDVLAWGALPGGINASLDSSVEGQLAVLLTGNASLAAYQSAIQSVTFSNSSDNPGATARVIEVTVNDGFVNSDPAVTTVTVVSTNDAPVAGNDNVITNIAGPVAISHALLMLNDTDPEGNPLSVTGASELNLNFSVVNNPTNVTATRTDGDNTKNFTYTVSDGSLSDSANVDLTWDTGASVDGGAGDDILLGSDGAHTFDAGAGNDIVFAGGGVDTIIWNANTTGATDGFDRVDGGLGTDTFDVNTRAGTAEVFRVYTRDAAEDAGIVVVGSTTEIVITRQAGGVTSVIAELDNIEEIRIGTQTADPTPGGAGGTPGDSVQIFGDFSTTSLALNTITIEGTDGDDTIDISSLTSAHRIVFKSNGGNDTIVGTLRPQDVIELPAGMTLDDFVENTDENGLTTLSDGEHTISYVSPHGSHVVETDDDEDDDDYDDEDEDEDDDEEDEDCDTDDEDDDDAPAPVHSGSVVGTPQDDLLVGTSGGDLVFGFAGTDHIIAGAGADVVRAGAGHDFVAGEAGRDVLFGEDGDDDMFGGNGDDMLYGEAGDDRLFGENGNDLLDGGDGDDAVFGGNGNDMFVASMNDGNDTYYGGDISEDTGNDTLDMGFLTVDVAVDLGTGANGRGSAVSSQSGTDTLWGVENVTTGSGNDTIVMSNAVNIVDGGQGEDVFVFGSATAAHGDTIRGFEAGDKIDLSGIDANTGMAGNDTFTLEGGQATTAPGQIVVTHETREDGEYTVVVGNTSGDNAPEFRINIAGNHALTADDFNL